MQARCWFQKCWECWRAAPWAWRLELIDSERAPMSGGGGTAPGKAADVSEGKRFQLWGTQCSATQRSEMLLDEVAVYSVTDARTADRITKLALKLDGARFKEICDGCACVGGNVLSFARALNKSRDTKVTGIELDPTRYEFLKHNVKTAGVNAEILNGDIAIATAADEPEDASDMIKAARLAVRRADLLFLDPPWGGPEVGSKPMGSVSFQMSGVDLADICKRCGSPDFKMRHMLLKIPPNYNTDKLKRDVADVADVKLETALRKMILAVVTFKQKPHEDDEEEENAAAPAAPDVADDDGAAPAAAPAAE